jgi:hypothetical protein
LFMELVNHVGNGEVVARMSETIAQQTEIIMNLAETNRALELERDLLTQEREFARAAAPAAPLAEGAPRPGLIQGVGGDTPTAPWPLPDVPAALVPQPREPKEQRRDGDAADSTPHVMSRARAQFSTSPTAGGGDHPDLAD